MFIIVLKIATAIGPEATAALRKAGFLKDIC